MKLVKPITIVDADHTMRRMFWHLDRYKSEIRVVGRKARRMSSRHTDAIARDLMIELKYVKGAKALEVARNLSRVSPHHPTAVTVLIRHDWDSMKDKAAELEQQYHDAPVVLGALGAKLAANHLDEAAVRVLRRYLDLAPEKWAYRRLAKVYKGLGDEDQWLSTLEEYLQQPDVGLGHASVRVQIARVFMEQDDYERVGQFI